MRRLRILLATALLGLAVPFAAHGMPLSDAQGDVPRSDVDIVGGEALLTGGKVVVKFKLADSLKRRDVYVAHIFGRGGEHWLLRAVRTGPGVADRARPRATQARRRERRHGGPTGGDQLPRGSDGRREGRLPLLPVRRRAGPTSGA